MTGNTKSDNAKAKTRKTRVIKEFETVQMLPADAAPLIKENKELGSLVTNLIISIEKGIFKNLSPEIKEQVIAIIKDAQKQVELSESLSTKHEELKKTNDKLTGLDIRELQLCNREIKNAIAIFKATHEQEELLAKLEVIKRSKNYVEQQFDDRYSSICNDIDGKIILLNAELDKFKHQKKRLTTDQIIDELQKQNELIKNTLEKIDVQREILSLADNYLVLESQYQALNHAVSEKLQIKEKHVKKGMTPIVQETWKNIEKIAANCEKANSNLQEKALPIEGRISILESRVRLFTKTLHSIDAELTFLKDIYPETLDMKAHNDRKLLIIEIYGSLKNKVATTNKILETELSLEDKQTIQQHKDFLSKEMKKIESIMEVVAQSLNTTNPSNNQHTSLNHKQYAEVASAVIVMNEHKISIEAHCDFIIDKAKLIKLDAEIAKQIEVLDKLNSKYEEIWSTLYHGLHRHASHTLFANSLKPILLDEGKRTFSFSPEQFQIKTSSTLLQADNTFEEREQFVKEREGLKQKLDDKKTKINGINSKIQQAAKAQQQRLEPLRKELSELIKLAVVTSSFLDDERMEASITRYAKIHQALNFDFTNLNSPKSASLLLALLNCNLSDENVQDSSLAIRLREDIKTLNNAKENFLNKYPDILVKNPEQFNYNGNVYPKVSGKLPESIKKAAQDYSTARLAIVNNDKLHPRIEDIQTLLANQTIIDSFVNDQEQAYKKEQDANAKIEKASQAKRIQEEAERQEMERIAQKLTKVKSKLEQQRAVIIDKEKIIKDMTLKLAEQKTAISKESPDDARIELLKSVETMLVKHTNSLDTLSLKISKVIPDVMFVKSKLHLDFMNRALAQFHDENKTLTDNLVIDIKKQFTAENLTKFTLSTSLLDQALQFIDKVIIPKLYKLVHKTEKPYTPGLFSSKTETNLFAFRKTIIPRIDTIVEEQNNAAPSA